MITKRKLLLLAAGSLVVVLLMAACQKSRYCHCVSSEINDTIIINAERGFNCDRIVNMGIEEIQDGQTVVTTHAYTCEKIKKDSIGNYPNLHHED